MWDSSVIIFEIYYSQFSILLSALVSSFVSCAQKAYTTSFQLFQCSSIIVSFSWNFSIVFVSFFSLLQQTKTLSSFSPFLHPAPFCFLLNAHSHNTTSVSRFDEISPLWQKFKSFWPFLESLFRIWQNFVPTLDKFICYWVNFHCCKQPNIELII